MRSERLALTLALAGCVENHVSATLSTEIGPWLCGAGEGEPLLESETPVAEAGRCRFALSERTLLCAADLDRFGTLRPTLVPVTESRAVFVTWVPRGRPWLVDLDAPAGFPTWAVEGLEPESSLGWLLAVEAPGEGLLLAGEPQSDTVFVYPQWLFGAARRGEGTVEVEPTPTGGSLSPTRVGLCSLDFNSGPAAVGRAVPGAAPGGLAFLWGAPTALEARTYGATAFVPPLGEAGRLHLLDATCHPDPVVRTWPAEADGSTAGGIAFQTFGAAETPEPRLYSLLPGEVAALRRTRWPAPDRPESMDVPLPDFDASQTFTVLTEGGDPVVVQAAAGRGGLRLAHVDFDAVGGPALSTATFEATLTGSLAVMRAHFEDEDDGHIRFFMSRSDEAERRSDVWRLDFEVRCDAP